MYELACRSIGVDLAVLPYSPASNTDRWLLKLHGCVSHPDDIVLTREHYMRYQTRRSALSGIVQSLLITRHMLFVGFSLRDDNFHRIVDVRAFTEYCECDRPYFLGGSAVGTNGR